MSSKAHKFHNLATSSQDILFLEDLSSDRAMLEEMAMKAVCACRYYDLADMLHETPDIDLLAIVTRADPCEICDQ